MRAAAGRCRPTAAVCSIRRPALHAVQARQPPNQLSLFEIGCGSGGNLLELLRLGFAPARPLATSSCRSVPPPPGAFCPVRCGSLGDATTLEIAPGSLDIVFQSTVFSSLLGPEFQELPARQMWRWVKPGGAVLWHEFTCGHLE